MSSPRITPKAERILETASTLFYDQGIHAVGVDLVAQESGVTKRTLYDRFGSKEALVIAYLERREAMWREVLLLELEEHAVPGIDQILAVFHAAKSMHDDLSKGCSAINARAEEAADVDGSAVTELVVAQKAWMRELFERLCHEAGFADAAQLGRQLQLLYDGALVSFGTRAVDDPLKVASDIAAMLLHAQRLK